MNATPRFVIVGGGLAAASAAGELRTQGFEGSIRIIASEPHPPYIRPPLSKGYLAGSDGLDAVYVHPDDWYGQQRIELTLGTKALRLDAAERTLELAGGERVEYDKLLLATGSSPRLLTIDGAELEGVHYLRTLDDSNALH